MSDFNSIVKTPSSSLDEEMLSLCKSVEAKRAKTVIDHILEHGIITNEELSEVYGYDHPPRAVRDVRENGIPLITHSVVSPKTGRRMGAYTFDNSSQIKAGRVGGRKAFSKKFKQLLINLYGSRDALTGQALEERYLQIDHRVPYEIVGDSAGILDPKDFMLLDASSNRAKSWSCENCLNFNNSRDASICSSCFWASPQSYNHIAMSESRRIDIVWSADEIDSYNKIFQEASILELNLADYIKEKLSK